MNGIGAGALRVFLLFPLLRVTLGQESLCDQNDVRTVYPFREELIDGSRNVSLTEFFGKVGSFVPFRSRIFLHLSCMTEMVIIHTLREIEAGLKQVFYWLVITSL